MDLGCQEDDKKIDISANLLYSVREMETKNLARRAWAVSVYLSISGGRNKLESNAGPAAPKRSASQTV